MVYVLVVNLYGKYQLWLTGSCLKFDIRGAESDIKDGDSSIKGTLSDIEVVESDIKVVVWH